MNFKKYHESKNLFDGTKIEAGRINDTTGAVEYATGTTLLSFDNETVTISTSVAWRGFVTDFINIQEYLQWSYVSDTIMYGYEYAYDVNKEFLGSVSLSEVPTGTKYVRISFQLVTAVTNAKIKNIMLNSGSTALPYEPYSSEVWHNIPHYIHNAATDTITTLPADLYADGNNATVGILGNMSQTGTPTPQNPITPSECGDLETEGAKAGQYKIPISSANTTTPVYLGEVQSTRKIKEAVLTGQENWTKNDAGNPSNYLYYQTGYLANKTCVCSHLEDMGTLSASKVGVFNGNNVLYLNFGSAIMNAQPSGNTVEGLKQYLAAQYANGTPVTVWYVLATPTTGIVNEPLRKIGNYADTVSGITIPTITGKDTFDVQTTLKPSEVSLAYTGWHDASVKEWDGSDWQ